MLRQPDPRPRACDALATVKTNVKDLAEPVVFGERRFTSGCGLKIQGLAPLRTGVELQPLVP